MASEIKLLGQDDRPGNPLTLLSAGLAELLVPLREIAKNTRTSEHVYALAAAGDEAKGWGVYCQACSSDAQAYTWPCRLDPVVGDTTPPEFFTMVAPKH